MWTDLFRKVQLFNKCSQAVNRWARSTGKHMSSTNTQAASLIVVWFSPRVSLLYAHACSCSGLPFARTATVSPSRVSNIPKKTRVPKKTMVQSGPSTTFTEQRVGAAEMTPTGTQCATSKCVASALPQQGPHHTTHNCFRKKVLCCQKGAPKQEYKELLVQWGT